MKKQLFNLAAILLIAGFSNSLMAQETATANVEATIVTPISITKTIDMNFGNVAVQSTNPGTVVLLPAGTRSATGGVTLPTTAPGTITAASFDVAGVGLYTFAVTLPADVVLTDGSAGVMTVNAFTSSAGVGGTAALAAGGTYTLTVGATLNVLAAQTAGVYTNTFDVTVNYN